MTKEDQAINLIIQLENVKLQAYLDSTGLPTIGAGTTVYPTGVKVKLGDTCLRSQVAIWVDNHLQRFVYSQVDALCDHHDVPDRVYAALCSFGYNEGAGFFTHISFTAPIIANDWGKFNAVNKTATGLAGTFLKYDKQTIEGQLIFCQGLQNRRIKEIKYFLGV